MARTLRILIAGNADKTGVRAAAGDLCRLISMHRTLKCMGIDLSQKSGEYFFGALLEYCKANIELTEVFLQFFQTLKHETVVVQGGTRIIGNYTEDNKQSFLPDYRFLLSP